MKDKKKLAIQFFGHLRTYDKTYKSFFENIIDVNKKEWEIDIFIHTFDTINGSKPATHWWHDGYEESWDKTPIDSKIQEEIKSIYKPKKLSITHLNPGEYGISITFQKTNELRIEYEKEKNIKYDLYFYTRPDIFFETPLIINKYLDEYKNNIELKNLGLPETYIFCGSNVFQRMCVSDPRYACESDLVFFSNAPMLSSFSTDKLKIQMDYRLYKDFFIFRYYGKWQGNTEHYKNKFLEEKYTDLLKQYKEVKSILEKHNISYNTNIKYCAEDIIKNSLEYKLGKVIVENSNSLLDYIKLPFILSYIKKEYSGGQDTNLESYPDYNKASILMQTLEYRLGYAYIKASRVWYKGYLRFLFRAISIKREFNKK